MENKVFFAKSYDEAHKIELAESPDSFVLSLKRLFVSIWVVLSNLLLFSFTRILFRKYNKKIQPAKIIVYTVGTLGDNVLMLPAIAAIKNTFPASKITAIVNCNGFSNGPARSILEPSIMIDKLITLPSHPVQRQGYSLHINIPDNLEKGCDLFVNLSPFGNRGWIGAVLREMIYARKLGSKTVIGFKMSTYTRGDIFNKIQHFHVKNETRRTYKILNTVAAKPVFDKDLLPSNESAKKRVNELIASHKNNNASPVILINPGAKLAASHWPAERFGAIAKWLKENYKALVFVNGTESEKSICQKVVKFSDYTAIDLAGLLDIQELIELLRTSALLVTNNTGPMTLSSMIKTPTVVIASTRFSPAFYMPENDRMVWVFSYDENSYSYNDAGGPGKDLLNITVKHVQDAIRTLDIIRVRPKT